MGKGAWQWQTGLQWTGSNSSSFQDQNFLSEHVLRFGAFEDFDVALLLNLDRNQRTFNDESTSETGLSLWGVRLRDHLYSGDGIISGLAWQFDILLPNVREYSRDTYASAQWTAMVDFKLSDQLGLSTNAGLRWVEASRAPLGLYVANLNYSFGRHTVFIEHYSQQVPNGSWPLQFDGGMGYWLNPNFLLDVSAGYTSLENTDIYFVNAGFSWRFFSTRS